MEKEDEITWLNPDIEANQLLSLLKAFNTDTIEEWEVGASAKNPINDYRMLLSQLKAAGKEQFFHVNEC